jgi:hypothetical protein
VPGGETLGHLHGLLIVDRSREVPSPRSVGVLAPLSGELLLGAHQRLAHDAETGTHLDHRIPKRPTAVRR